MGAMRAIGAVGAMRAIGAMGARTAMGAVVLAATVWPLHAAEAPLATAVQKMDRVYQQASLNMGWCVKCHVNGYDPVEGQRATGYPGTDTISTVTPAAERKRARYDCASCHY